jgi:hypothetical protein
MQAREDGGCVVINFHMRPRYNCNETDKIIKNFERTANSLAES